MPEKGTLFLFIPNSMHLSPLSAGSKNATLSHMIFRTFFTLIIIGLFNPFSPLGQASDLVCEKTFTASSRSEQFSTPSSLNEKLFQALLIHDNSYPLAKLPKQLTFDFSKKSLTAYYSINYILWAKTFDPVRLIDHIRFIMKANQYLAHTPSASAGHMPLIHPQILAHHESEFKNIRAAAKQMRFAYLLFGKKHEEPKRLDTLTTSLGHFKDAISHGELEAAANYLEKIERLLGQKELNKMQEELLSLNLSNEDSLKKFIAEELKFLKKTMSDKKITGKDFHDSRKVMSRLVALFDTLQTVTPSAGYLAVVQVLSTFNGQMGRMHDELIEAHYQNQLDYKKDKFPLSIELQKSILEFIKKFRDLLDL